MRTHAVVAMLAVPGALTHAQQLLSIEIVGPDEVLEPSETQYECIAHFDKGDLNVTGQAEWSVAPDNELVSIDGGLLTIADLDADINVTITATYEVLGVEKTTTFMVLANAPDLISVVISGPTQIFHESVTQYQCTALFEFGEEIDVTDQAIWTVEPDELAAIEAGLLSVGTLNTPVEMTLSAEVAAGGITVEGLLNVFVAPVSVVYDNQYDGTSTYGFAGQIFEREFSGYDIWVGDDFSSNSDLSLVWISSAGRCGNGCVDPFLVQDFLAAIWDRLPNDPNATLVAESDSSEYDDGTGVRTAFFEDDLSAGDYYFAFAARNDFGTNGQTYFWQQTIDGEQDDGWQWNPNGAFGFPDDLKYLTEDDDDVVPTSPNAVILSAEVCLADCNADGDLSVLDFVCFQLLWQSGDLAADCDGNGVLNLLDFVCFQIEYQEGCG